MSRIEHLIVRLDQGTSGALLRFALGAAVPMAWLVVAGPQGAEWTVFPFYLSVLIAVRVLPAIARRWLRFSDSTRRVWSDRRQLAKRCDCYQWQKLFWVGLGSTFSLALWGPPSAGLQVLAAICVLSGGLGLLRWRFWTAPGESARRGGRVTQGPLDERVVKSAVVSLRGES